MGNWENPNAWKLFSRKLPGEQASNRRTVDLEGHVVLLFFTMALTFVGPWSRGHPVGG